MKYLGLLSLTVALSCGPFLAYASSSSPVAYDIILIIVILELIFAFSVGVACILFSFNLILTLKESSSEMMDSLAVGDLPPSRVSLHQRDSETSKRETFDESHESKAEGTLDYKTFRDNPRSRTMNGVSFGSEFDVERQLPDHQPQPNGFGQVLRTFYSYIRLW